MRAENSLNQSDYDEDGDKWADSRNIQDAKFAGFGDELDREREKVGGIRVTPRLLVCTLGQ